MPNTMTFDEMATHWEGHRMVKWPRRTLALVNIPVASKDYLADVGFPGDIEWFLRFTDEWLELPSQPKHPSWRAFGADNEYPLCVDEAKKGAVTATAPDDQHRFVNSAVELFGECLIHFDRVRLARPDDMPVAELQRVAKEMKARLQKCDAAAFANGDTWWQSIIDQMADGLL